MKSVKLDRSQLHVLRRLKKAPYGTISREKLATTPKIKKAIASLLRRKAIRYLKTKDSYKLMNLGKVFLEVRKVKPSPKDKKNKTTSGSKSASPLKEGKWRTKSGYKKAYDWLHEDGDKHYEKRSKLYEAAKERAWELVAVQYPHRTENAIKDDPKGKKKLAPFIEYGKRKGRRSKRIGAIYPIVRTVQSNIMSSTLIKAHEEGKKDPKMEDVRCAGKDKLPCMSAGMNQLLRKTPVRKQKKSAA